MLLQQFSMRTSLVLTILAMGLLALLLSVFTGEIYRHLAMENQQVALESLIDLKVQHHLEDTASRIEQLGLAVQKEKSFRSILQTSDRKAIETKLAEYFHNDFVATSQLDVKQLIVFDTQFNVLTAVTKESAGFNDAPHLCPSLINKSRLRTGKERLQAFSQLCISNGQALMSSMVPIGNPNLVGYLQVSIDPVLSLQQLEQELGMPLILANLGKGSAYVSKHWPKPDALEHVLVIEHLLKDERQRAVLNMRLAYDVEVLHKELEKARIYIMLAVAIVTAIAVLLSLMLLQQTMLSPLNRLTKQLSKVKHDKTHLAEKLAVEGNLEVRSLATGFNEMGEELYTLYNTLEDMAFTDALTGLPNRSLFYDRLEQLALINQRESRPYAVFMMDLDRFKMVNDTLGHHVGDELLKMISDRLKQTMVRKTDTIARLGGDEFASILPQVQDQDSATIVAKRLIQSLDQSFLVEGHSLNIGISIGIVVCPHHGLEGNELIQRADVAMYHAKKNQQGYAWYESEFDTYNIDQLTLDSELKQAIENNELELHYQPKIDFQSGRIKSVEALVRWPHPEQGLIPPDRFIPVAEQTGLIHPLTRWVLNTALHQIAQWQQQHILLNVAVNLSALSLRDTNLDSMLQDSLDRAGVSPECLTLELTESAVMANPQQALATLSKLDAMGVSLAVDDFGTGYSSLAYLKRLPVDELKIDRSFVMDMDKDTNDEVIVRSTIDLAHNMGLKVIAEGIENQHSWDKLAEMGCDLGQGYFMGRPQPAVALEAWLVDSCWGLGSGQSPNQER